jgi:response regulator RpfG family c-di-GMP phosphodiesterase
VVPWSSREALDNDREFLRRINQCGRMGDDDHARLRAIGELTYTDLQGNRLSLLSLHEREALAVTRGNLTAAEREMINSHARSTFRILSQIPWTGSLLKVPEIAAQHHERINGTGYPDGITGDRMFLESKILAVIDIYEALVAQDRPYKPKMSSETALAILDEEAKTGHVDAEVVRFFREKGIYLLHIDEEGKTS